MSVLDRLKGLLGAASLRRPEEDVRDFIGVVELDTDAGMGVIVMPEHCAAVVRLSGTDYAYASPEVREEIVSGWASALNSAGVSVQLFVNVRPMRWRLPGGFLDQMKTQTEADLKSEWQRRRYERMEEAILRGELDIYPALEVHQFAILRYGIGLSENKRFGSGEHAMYIPPRRGLRFWETPKTEFGSGEEGLRAWRARRDEAINALSLVVERFLRDVTAVPGMSASICTGLEISQLLHGLWRGEGALDEWITDETMLEAIRTGELSADWLAPKPIDHEKPVDLGRRRD